MTKLLLETRISLTQAAQQLGVNTSTCWRWAQKGVRNIRLETFSIGAKRYTTEESLERFVEKTTRAAKGQGEGSRPSTIRQRSKAVEQSMRECEEQGL